MGKLEMKDMTEGKKHIMQNKNTSVIGVMLLLICAFVWGTTFVAQSTAADTMGPFTYLFSRSIIATVFLSILVIIFDHMGKVTHRPENAEEKRNLRIGGFLCGVILCKLLSAIRNCIYNSRKSRLYNSFLYRHGSGTWHIFR